jgi:hypothetical protein
MSWREREFSHESDAYYRSLDQVASGPLEAFAGYHIEDGQSVCDWVKYQGKRITFPRTSTSPNSEDSGQVRVS